MSNALHIRLTKFEVRRSTSAEYGYTAYDDDNTTYSGLANSWEGLKKEYPTLKSLLEAVLAEDVFSGLTPEYSIDGLRIEVVPDKDEYSNRFSHITLDGFEGFY